MTRNASIDRDARPSETSQPAAKENPGLIVASPFANETSTHAVQALATPEPVPAPPLAPPVIDPEYLASSPSPPEGAPGMDVPSFAPAPAMHPPAPVVPPPTPAMHPPAPLVGPPAHPVEAATVGLHPASSMSMRPELVRSSLPEPPAETSAPPGASIVMPEVSSAAMSHAAASRAAMPQAAGSSARYGSPAASADHLFMARSARAWTIAAVLVWSGVFVVVIAWLASTSMDEPPPSETDTKGTPVVADPGTATSSPTNAPAPQHPIATVKTPPPAWTKGNQRSHNSDDEEEMWEEAWEKALEHMEKKRKKERKKGRRGR